MEQRQCDASGLATDASRMLEKWTKGKHANPSDSSRVCLRKRVLFSASAKATSYASIFAEKDFIRAEKQCFKFYEAYRKGQSSGAEPMEKKASLLADEYV